MAGAKRMDNMHPMAESFCEAKLTLDQVFRFYKWRRHAPGFPEEVYLLLSRCMYVCFSLWRSDQENQGEFFRRSPPPTAFWIGLDFAKLQASERGGPAVSADAWPDHFTNDTKWFDFWMKTLEQSDPRAAPIYREFSRHILACLGRQDLLDVKVGYRNRKALDLFLKENEAGRVLLRTIAVLEDLIQAIVRYFATLDGRTCVLEKVALLTGFLSEMRQILVWETPAKGPYSPSSDARWSGRSPLTWLSHDRTPGVLTVIPRREGGEILCISHPASDAKGRRASWVRKVASLKGTYEEALFATWSYDTGAHRKNPEKFPGVTAGWTVQYAEAQRLETLARQVDLLLASLQGNPRCQRLVEAVRGVLRNGASRWKATVLPWTYVKQLDQLLEKLTSVYREANPLRGGDAAERVVAQIWTSEETTTAGAGSSHGPAGPSGEASHTAASQDMTRALGEVKFILPKADPDALDQPPQKPESAEYSPEADAETAVEKPPEERAVSELSAQAEIGTSAEKLPGERELAEQSPEAQAQTPAQRPPEERERSEQTPEVEAQTVAQKPPEEPELSEPSPEAGMETAEEVSPREPESSEPRSEAEMETRADEPAEQPESLGRGPETEMEMSAEKPPEERESAEQSPESQAETTVERLDSSGEDSQTEDPAPIHEEHTTPAASEEVGARERPPSVAAAPSRGLAETDAAQAVVPAARKKPAPKPARKKRTTNVSRPEEIDDVLLRRLLEHHGCPGGTVNCEPLSAAQLQRDLGWTPSKVQRALTNIFGPKPVNVYRSKCKDRSIAAFLRARAAGVRRPAKHAAPA
jgi:hypothetical protein